MRKIMLMAAGLAIGALAVAQPGNAPGRPVHEGRDSSACCCENHRPGSQKPLTVEEEAQRTADMMNRELGLTSRQVKKLVKFYKSDIQYRRDAMQVPPQGGKPHGEGRPEGRPEGMRPGGMPQGGPGGAPGGMRPGGPGNGGPQMGSGAPRLKAPVDEEMEKYNEKQEKKLKKILGEEKYTQWRSAHPAPSVPMPEPTF